MTRTFLTGLIALAASAVLMVGAAQAHGAPTIEGFAIDIGTTEKFHLLPYIEQDNLVKGGAETIVLRRLRADPDVVLPRSEAGYVLAFETASSNAAQIFAWHQSVVEGQIAARKDTVLVLSDADGRPTAKYLLVAAWPSSLAFSPQAPTSEGFVDFDLAFADVRRLPL